MVYSLAAITTRVFFRKGRARRGIVSHNRAVGDTGLGEGQQRSHKPLVDGSNPFLATDVNCDQELRESRKALGHFFICDEGLCKAHMASVSIIVAVPGYDRVQARTEKRYVGDQGLH